MKLRRLFFVLSAWGLSGASATAQETAPTAITDPAAEVSAATATLRGRVNPNGFATTCRFEYGLTAAYGATTLVSDAGSGVSALLVSNRLTGLTAGATYHFRVVATNAGGCSNGVDRSFATLATGTPNQIFYEGFETNHIALPTGWSQAYIAHANDWEFNDGNGYTSHPAHAYMGTNNAVFFWTNDTTRLITPAIDFGIRTHSARLTFWHYMEVWSGDQDELRVYYKTSASGSWIQLAHYTNNVDAWTQRTLSLPGANSTYYLAFEGISHWGYGVCLDEIRVTGEENVAPAVTPPAATTEAATSVGSASALFNGRVNPHCGATAVYFEYGADASYGSRTLGEDAGSGSSTVAVSRMVSGLASSRTYHVRLVASNSAGRTLGADRVFTTPAQSSVLLVEDFEHDGELPGGWTLEYVDGDYDWIAATGSTENEPPAAHGGSFNAFFLYEQGVTRFVTPTIDFGAATNQATLAFWQYMADRGNQDELRVYCKNSGNGVWTLLAAYDGSVASWTKRVLALPNPSSAYSIAFEGTARWGYGICVDDVEICGLADARYPDFTPAGFAPPTASGLILSWASVSDRLYMVQSATNLATGFSTAVSNLAATPPLNTYTSSAAGAWRFYRIGERLP